MRKISRHNGPYGRRHCVVKMRDNSRRERKWLGRMFRKRQGHDWRGGHDRWMSIGRAYLRAVESGNL